MTSDVESDDNWLVSFNEIQQAITGWPSASRLETTITAARERDSNFDIDWKPALASFTHLALCANRGHVALVRMLLEEFGANVNVPDRDGWTPLMLAANVETVRVLKHGADRGAKTSRVYENVPAGSTALDISRLRLHLLHFDDDEYSEYDERIALLTLPPVAPPVPPLI